MDFSQYGGKSEEWLQIEASLPPLPTLGPEELKRTTNETRANAAQEEMKQLRSRVLLHDFSIPTRDGSQLEARTYRSSSVDAKKQLPIYLHFHGGGFFFGTIASEDAICSRIAIETELVVINVNYRHTPEFTFPTAWLDSEDALAWVDQHAAEFSGDNSRIIVGGVSAGAYLTVTLMLALHRDKNLIRERILGQVLMVPPLVHRDHSEPYTQQLKDPSVSSWKENENAPMLPVSRIEFFNGMLFHQPTKADDRRANPGLASADELACMPPTTFGICGLDPLRDEGLIFAKMLQDNGVPTNVNVFRGLPHAFRMFGDKLPKSRQAWDNVIFDGIKWSLTNPVYLSVSDIRVH